MGVTTTTTSAATYTPIATTTLGSAASNITFSSISGSYTDIVAVFNGGASAGSNALALQLGNGSVDTSSNYSITFLSGNGSNAVSGRVSNNAYLYIDARATLPTTLTANAIISIQNYSNTNTYKTTISRYNDAAGEADATVGLWRSTSAINIIKLYPDSGANFLAGSTFTLYGVKAA